MNAPDGTKLPRRVPFLGLSSGRSIAEMADDGFRRLDRIEQKLDALLADREPGTGSQEPEKWPPFLIDSVMHEKLARIHKILELALLNNDRADIKWAADQIGDMLDRRSPL